MGACVDREREKSYPKTRKGERDRESDKNRRGLRGTAFEIPKLYFEIKYVFDVVRLKCNNYYNGMAWSLCIQN